MKISSLKIASKLSFWEGHKSYPKLPPILPSLIAMRHAPWKRRHVSSLRRYLTSWSRRSLSRCGLLDHILCEWQAVSQALFWVSVGGWGIILGGCGWVVVGGVLFWEVRVGGKIFWVGGGGWEYCFIMPIFYQHYYKYIFFILFSPVFLS